MLTFATPEPITATVKVAGARVRLAASDRAGTVVLVEPIDAANAAHVKVADKTKVDFDDGRLEVKTTVSGDETGSVAITIEMPAGSDLLASLAHSSVRADGPLGACELQVAAGQADLDRIETLQANIADGEIAIGHIAGRATMTGRSVAMRIGHAAADLDLTSRSGGFDIDRADGSVTAQAADAAIRIHRLAHGRAELMNRSGTIEIGIPEATVARVDAHSERGSVRNLLPSPEGSGTFDDEVAIRARTRCGDIVIRRATS